MVLAHHKLKSNRWVPIHRGHRVNRRTENEPALHSSAVSNVRSRLFARAVGGRRRRAARLVCDPLTYLPPLATQSDPLHPAPTCIRIVLVCLFMCPEDCSKVGTAMM
ncbi:unnamed protein product, partial [Iphiclides podalirius]